MQITALPVPVTVAQQFHAAQSPAETLGVALDLLWRDRVEDAGEEEAPALTLADLRTAAQEVRARWGRLPTAAEWQECGVARYSHPRGPVLSPPADALPPPDLEFRVPSRSHRGSTHLVRRTGGCWTCSCPGYANRDRCAHTQAAKDLEAMGELDAVLAAGSNRVQS